VSIVTSDKEVVAARAASAGWTLADASGSPAPELPWKEYYRIPGVSIAVASGDAVEWSKGYGVADAVTRRPITADALFQAASISKPIAAVTALSLFDSLGLDIDDDVRGYLDTWRMPETALTQRTPVTMRLLLSHCAGFNVHGFAGYAASAALAYLDRPVAFAVMTNSEVGDKILGPVIGALSAAYSR
jgi:CubicO group peptidase (beta-lactamase class C family)